MQEITLSFAELVTAFIIAMGIPSAVTGLIVWRLKKRIEDNEEIQDKKNNGQKELVLILVQSTRAAIALGEATARAVQRIPDAHCNGDMHRALDYATSVKHTQKEFLDKHGIDALLDD